MTTAYPKLLAYCVVLLVACTSDGGGGPVDGPRGGEGGVSGMDGGTGDASSAGGGVDGSVGDRGGAVPDDAVPYYGMPTIEPDTSTEKITECTGAPDMTLCDVVTTPDRWYDVCVGGVCVSPGCGDESCNTLGPHFPIPPFEGHIYLEKQPGEEPVTIDKITGLHWTSCPSGLTGAGCDGGAALDLELEGALTYCDELSWGGHNDWYLPDMFELISLADLDADASMTTGTTDLLDDHAFPNQQAVPSAFYWSTSLVRHDVTSFSTGQNQPGFSSIAYQQHRPTAALCVRRGFSKAMPAGERFVSHVDAPVGQPWTEDRVTGLVFQGCFSGPDGMCDGKHTGAEAVAHCRDLSWGGADDWRVANYKELQSIFDPNQAGDSPLPEEFFGENGGAYVFAAPGTLLGLNDMERVGIGIPENRYQVLCVRGPYAP